MQQINLYLPEFRPQRDFFTAEYTGIFLVIFCFSLIFLYSHKSSFMTQMEDRVTALEAQKKSITEQVQALKIKPTSNSRVQLDARVTELRAAILNRQAIASVISGQSLGNRSGFSDFLAALSQALVSGVSLSSFTLSQGGRYASLGGFSVEPESVPLYISRLRDDDAFKFTKFGFLSLRQDGDLAAFTLSGDGPISEELIEHQAKVLSTE